MNNFVFTKTTAQTCSVSLKVPHYDVIYNMMIIPQRERTWSRQQKCSLKNRISKMKRCASSDHVHNIKKKANWNGEGKSFA